MLNDRLWLRSVLAFAGVVTAAPCDSVSSDGFFVMF